jgi:hypothetical protein
VLDRCETSSQVNQFLKIVLSVLTADQKSEKTDKLGSFFELLFTFLQNVPQDAVNCETIHLLTQLRFTIQDQKQNECFFKALILSADFWINTESLEVMQDFWSFVKSIYSQDPVHFNQVFPISNLITLMVKLSDSHPSFCCFYHKRTNDLFYN